MKDFEQEQPKRKPKESGEKIKIYKAGVYVFRLESELQKYLDEGWTVAE